MSEPLYLMDVVLGAKLARAGVAEIREFPHRCDRGTAEILVERRAGAVAGEGRMRLVQDARLDADFVQAERDFIRVPR